MADPQLEAQRRQATQVTTPQVKTESAPDPKQLTEKQMEKLGFELARAGKDIINNPRLKEAARVQTAEQGNALRLGAQQWSAASADAMKIHKALHGGVLGLNDTDALYKILEGKSKGEIERIQKAYQDRFKNDLRTDIVNQYGGMFGNQKTSDALCAYIDGKHAVATVHRVHDVTSGWNGFVNYISRNQDSAVHDAIRSLKDSNEAQEFSTSYEQVSRRYGLPNNLSTTLGDANSAARVTFDLISQGKYVENEAKQLIRSVERTSMGFLSSPNEGEIERILTKASQDKEFRSALETALKGEGKTLDDLLGQLNPDSSIHTRAIAALDGNTALLEATKFRDATRTTVFGTFDMDWFGWGDAEAARSVFEGKSKEEIQLILKEISQLEDLSEARHSVLATVTRVFSGRERELVKLAMEGEPLTLDERVNQLERRVALENSGILAGLSDNDYRAIMTEQVEDVKALRKHVVEKRLDETLGEILGKANGDEANSAIDRFVEQRDSVADAAATVTMTAAGVAITVGTAGAGAGVGAAAIAGGVGATGAKYATVGAFKGFGADEFNAIDVGRDLAVNILSFALGGSASKALLQEAGKTVAVDSAVTISRATAFRTGFRFGAWDGALQAATDKESLRPALFATTLGEKANGAVQLTQSIATGAAVGGVIGGVTSLAFTPKHGIDHKNFRADARALKRDFIDSLDDLRHKFPSPSQKLGPEIRDGIEMLTRGNHPTTKLAALRGQIIDYVDANRHFLSHQDKRTFADVLSALGKADTKPEQKAVGATLAKLRNKIDARSRTHSAAHRGLGDLDNKVVNTISRLHQAGGEFTVVQSGLNPGEQTGLFQELKDFLTTNRTQLRLRPDQLTAFENATNALEHGTASVAQQKELAGILRKLETRAHAEFRAIKLPTSIATQIDTLTNAGKVIKGLDSGLPELELNAICDWFDQQKTGLKRLLQNDNFQKLSSAVEEIRKGGQPFYEEQHLIASALEQASEAVKARRTPLVADLQSQRKIIDKLGSGPLTPKEKNALLGLIDRMLHRDRHALLAAEYSRLDQLSRQVMSTPNDIGAKQELHKFLIEMTDSPMPARLVEHSEHIPKLRKAGTEIDVGVKPNLSDSELGVLGGQFDTILSDNTHHLSPNQIRKIHGVKTLIDDSRNAAPTSAAAAQNKLALALTDLQRDLSPRAATLAEFPAVVSRSKPVLTDPLHAAVLSPQEQSELGSAIKGWIGDNDHLLSSPQASQLRRAVKDLHTGKLDRDGQSALGTLLDEIDRARLTEPPLVRMPDNVRRSIGRFEQAGVEVAPPSGDMKLAGLNPDEQRTLAGQLSSWRKANSNETALGQNRRLLDEHITRLAAGTATDAEQNALAVLLDQLSEVGSRASTHPLPSELHTDLKDLTNAGRTRGSSAENGLGATDRKVISDRLERFQEHCRTNGGLTSQEENVLTRAITALRDKDLSAADQRTHAFHLNELFGKPVQAPWYSKARYRTWLMYADSAYRGVKAVPKPAAAGLGALYVAELPGRDSTDTPKLGVPVVRLAQSRGTGKEDGGTDINDRQRAAGESTNPNSPRAAGPSVTPKFVDTDMLINLAEAQFRLTDHPNLPPRLLLLTLAAEGLDQNGETLTLTDLPNLPGSLNRQNLPAVYRAVMTRADRLSYHLGQNSGDLDRTIESYANEVKFPGGGKALLERMNALNVANSPVRNMLNSQRRLGPSEVEAFRLVAEDPQLWVVKHAVELGKSGSIDPHSFLEASPFGRRYLQWRAYVNGGITLPDDFDYEKQAEIVRLATANLKNVHAEAPVIAAVERVSSELSQMSARSELPKFAPGTSASVTNPISAAALRELGTDVVTRIEQTGNLPSSMLQAVKRIEANALLDQVFHHYYKQSGNQAEAKRKATDVLGRIGELITEDSQAARVEPRETVDDTTSGSSGMAAIPAEPVAEPVVSPEGQRTTLTAWSNSAPADEANSTQQTLLIRSEESQPAAATEQQTVLTVSESTPTDIIPPQALREQSEGLGILPQHRIGRMLRNYEREFSLRESGTPTPEQIANLYRSGLEIQQLLDDRRALIERRGGL